MCLRFNDSEQEPGGGPPDDRIFQVRRIHLAGTPASTARKL